MSQQFKRPSPNPQWTSSKVRETFLKYFEKNKHTRVRSSSLVPEGDATLLFTNAGMNQFKNAFLGLEQRPYSRATTSQKCVRAGGKHNDLENVGFTARHHTFFEMLGNFSFGDYFKKDAIRFAWELLTKEYKLPKEKLWVTVFETDDEAAEIWMKQENIPAERISRFGEADNFWRMGDTGPCGPCTEIFYDHGPEAGCGKPTCKVGCSCDRYVEIWNLVFMQYFEDASGLTPLPKPSVDTGSGLERVTAVLQGQPNNYHTDAFWPLILKAEEISGLNYNPTEASGASMRVLADHARTTAFLIADGVLPSNEGRGYVLRRIIRRALRHGRKLSTSQSIMVPLVETVISQMSEFYSELTQQKAHILSTLKQEEERFLATLDKGTELLKEALNDLRKKKQKVMDGATVFKLYDTYGFPTDLTRVMVEEEGFQIDEASFEKHAEEARKLSQASWKGQAINQNEAHLIQFANGFKPTDFEGYLKTELRGQILGLSTGEATIDKVKEGDKGFLVIDRSPFYAEGGGQVGDQGVIKTESGTLEISDCFKRGEVFIHQFVVTQGSVQKGQSATLTVNQSLRRQTMSNHSATHLLHAALRKHLGAHISQAGSHVDSNRLRFDFTHSKSLSPADILEIEKLVNQEIGKATDISPTVMDLKEAMNSGAVALFGEKYGDRVRVIKMGDFSTELCGGTHVSRTSDIRIFKITSEGSVSSGVRRIEAITGEKAVQYLFWSEKNLSEAHAQVNLRSPWQSYVNQSSTTEGESLAQGIQKVQSEKVALEKELKKQQTQKIDFDQIIANATLVGDASIVYSQLPLDDRELLSQSVDRLRDRLKKGIVIAVGEGTGGSFPLLVSVTKDFTQTYQAGQIIRKICESAGGKGGGRPDYAQGAVTHPEKVLPALHEIFGKTILH